MGAPQDSLQLADDPVGVSEIGVVQVYPLGERRRIPGALHVGHRVLIDALMVVFRAVAWWVGMLEEGRHVNGL